MAIREITNAEAKERIKSWTGVDIGSVPDLDAAAKSARPAMSAPESPEEVARMNRRLRQVNAGGWTRAEMTANAGRPAPGYEDVRGWYREMEDADTAAGWKHSPDNQSFIKRFWTEVERGVGEGYDALSDADNWKSAGRAMQSFENWKDWGKSFVHGFVGTVPGVISAAGALTSADWLVNTGAKLGSFLDDHLGDADPNFGNSLASGLGSFVSFFIPGALVAKGIRGTAAAARIAATLGKGGAVGRMVNYVVGPSGLAGSATMATLESLVEAGTLTNELIAGGMGRDEAYSRGRALLAPDIALTMLLDSPYFQRGPRLLKVFTSSLSEGTQEMAQGNASDWAAGRKTASEALIPDHFEEFAVGALIGMAGAIISDEAASPEDRQRRAEFDKIGLLKGADSRIRGDVDFDSIDMTEAGDVDQAKLAETAVALAQRARARTSDELVGFAMKVREAADKGAKINLTTGLAYQIAQNELGRRDLVDRIEAEVDNKNLAAAIVQAERVGWEKLTPQEKGMLLAAMDAAAARIGTGRGNPDLERVFFETAEKMTASVRPDLMAEYGLAKKQAGKEPAGAAGAAAKEGAAGGPATDGATPAPAAPAAKPRAKKKPAEKAPSEPAAEPSSGAPASAPAAQEPAQEQPKAPAAKSKPAEPTAAKAQAHDRAQDINKNSEMAYKTGTRWGGPEPGQRAAWDGLPEIEVKLQAQEQLAAEAGGPDKVTTQRRREITTAAKAVYKKIAGSNGHFWASASGSDPTFGIESVLSPTEREALGLMERAGIVERIVAPDGRQYIGVAGRPIPAGDGGKPAGTIVTPEPYTPPPPPAKPGARLAPKKRAAPTQAQAQAKPAAVEPAPAPYSKTTPQSVQALARAPGLQRILAPVGSAVRGINEVALGKSAAEIMAMTDDEIIEAARRRSPRTLGQARIVKAPVTRNDPLFKAGVALAEKLGMRVLVFTGGARNMHGFSIPGTNIIASRNGDPAWIAGVIVHEAVHEVVAREFDLFVDLFDKAIAAGYSGRSFETLHPSYRDTPDEFFARVAQLAATEQKFWDTIANENPEAAKSFHDAIVRGLYRIKKAIEGFFRGPTDRNDPRYYMKEIDNLYEPIAKMFAEAMRRHQLRDPSDYIKAVSPSAKPLVVADVQAAIKLYTDDAKNPALASGMERNAAGDPGGRSIRAAVSGFVPDLGHRVYAALVDDLHLLKVALERATGKSADELIKNGRSVYHVIRGIVRSWAVEAQMVTMFGPRSMFNNRLGFNKSGERIEKGTVDKTAVRGVSEIMNAYGIHGERYRRFGQYLRDRRFVAVYDEIVSDLIARGLSGDALVKAMKKRITDAAIMDYPRAVASVKTEDAAGDSFSKAAEELNGFANGVLGMMEEVGIINKEQRLKIINKYDFYMPLSEARVQYRGLGFGGAVGIRGKKITPFAQKGIRRQGVLDIAPTVHPVESLVKNTYRAVEISRKNYAKNKLAELTESFPSVGLVSSSTGKKKPVFTSRQQAYLASGARDALLARVAELVAMDEIDLDAAEELSEAIKTGEFPAGPARLWVADTDLGENMVGFFRDGEFMVMQVTPDVYEGFVNAGHREAGWLVNILGKATAFLRAGAVLTPEFMARNPVRDVVAASVLASRVFSGSPKHVAKFYATWLSSLVSTIKKDQDYQSWVTAGGPMADFFSQDQRDVSDTTETLIETGSSDAARVVVHTIKSKKAGAVISALRYMSGLTETATRLAVYRVAMGKEVEIDGKKIKLSDLQTDDSVSEEFFHAAAIAALESREASLDFNRIGSLGYAINKIIPFFNAGVQGLDKMFRTLGEVDANGRPTAAAMQAWGRATALTLATMALHGYNYDDKDERGEYWYRKRSRFEKNMFWLISWDHGKTIWRIPKPFEIGLMFASLPERIAEQIHGDDPRAMQSWLHQMEATALLSPFQMVQQAVPPITALANAKANYDPFRGSPIVKGSMQDLPGWMQYTDSTSRFAKDLARFVYDYFPESMGPGGEPVELSPLKIDYVIQGTAAGLGRTAVSIHDLIKDGIFPDYDEPAKIGLRFRAPVIKAFTVNPDAPYDRYTEDFFQMADRAERVFRGVNANMSPRMDTDAVLSELRRNGEWFIMHDYLAEVGQQVQAINSAIAVVTNQPVPEGSSGAQIEAIKKHKREKINELYRARGVIVRGAVEMVDANRKNISDQAEALIGAMERNRKEGK